MNRHYSAPLIHTYQSQVEDEQSTSVSLSSASSAQSDPVQTNPLEPQHAILQQLIGLSPEQQLGILQQLLTHLEIDQIESLIKLGLQEIGDRRRRSNLNIAQTHLLLKKDYSYRERGLDEPTQYYVYLRRRKPKLDRYIGALFYIPQGCKLSYSQNSDGRILFHPPHCFQLRDSRNPDIVRVVRLIALEPPSSDYTFDKQQNDTPNIGLHLEYLDPETHQILSQEQYPFPICMYERGTLDRYRWEVSPIIDKMIPTK